MQNVVEAFIAEFKKTPRVFVAPGRVNLIGEHTDYNDGFVMPAAIDKHFAFALAPTGDHNLHLFAVDLQEHASFSLDALQAGHLWKNYFMGVVDGMQRRGKKPGGVACAFGSTIPPGSGLSSSAALCSGFGFALNEIFNLGLSRLDLAHIAQEAEHRFAGVKVGIMDMYASLFGHRDEVMLLDCRTQQHQSLPLQLGDHEIFLVDTKVKHSLASSGYNDRRASCEEGVTIIRANDGSVSSLRDVSRSMLDEVREKLDPVVFKRCSYVVDEIERTRQAAALLRSNDIAGFGRLMYDTHWGLSLDYEISCEESDWLVRLAEQKGVVGARQMGGGFGGCTINLLKKDGRGDFEHAVREKYFNRFKKEPEFYSVNLANGVHEAEPHVRNNQIAQ